MVKMGQMAQDNALKTRLLTNLPNLHQIALVTLNVTRTHAHSSRSVHLNELARQIARQPGTPLGCRSY
jgi:hypothetical protein